MKRPGIPYSPQYAFVRARQLEGTYPGDPKTGVWPITEARISWGWGAIPEEAWPFKTSDWPPAEPPGLDILARRNLGPRYQRVRSLYECKLVLAYHSPLLASIEITRAWFDAPRGRVPEESLKESSIGSHCVTLAGYDDSKRQLKFLNSWGRNWGDKGYGYISYDVFERTWREGWFRPGGAKQPPTGPGQGLKQRAWGAREFGGGIFHGREIVGPNEERIAWAFAIQRAGSLDVEEMFVKPEHRRKGYGRALARMLGCLAADCQEQLRVWVSYPDATAESLLVIERVFAPLGLELRVAPVRWAPFVMCPIQADLDPSSLEIQEPIRGPRGRFRKRAKRRSPAT